MLNIYSNKDRDWGLKQDLCVIIDQHVVSGKIKELT